MCQIRESVLVRCRGCGLIRTQKSPAQLDAISSQYDTDEDHLDVYLKHYSSPRLETYRRWLPKIRRFRQTGRILEIGCGPGLFLHAAKEADWTAIGLDISTVEVQYARETLGVDARVQQIDEIQEPEESFDGVVFWDVLEHLNDPVGVLTSAARLVRSDGFLLCRVPNAEIFDVNARNPVDGFMLRLYLSRIFPLLPEQHLFHFSPATLGMALATAGWYSETLSKEESLSEIAILSNRWHKRVAKHAIFRYIRRRRWPHEFITLARRGIDS